MNQLVLIPTVRRPVARRFDAVSITLHWATVALLIGLFASALALPFAAGADQARGMLTLHRSLGSAAWLLAVCRLGWRLRFAVRPPLPATVNRRQRLAARLTEAALYAILLVQPLTGLAQSVARGRAFELFAVEVPKLMAKDKPLTAALHQIHAVTAWVLLGLIGLHVAAALFHRFVQRDQVLQAMLPWPEKIQALGNKPRRAPVSLFDNRHGADR